MSSKPVLIFDTTLRDGEQSPGASLEVKEKIEIARQLLKLNVDVIEAGYPHASPGQYEAVRAISAEIPKTIAALARTKEDDLRAAGRALEQAHLSRIHTFIGTSDFHIQGKFASSRYGASIQEKRKTVLKMASDAVAFGRTLVDEVEFSPEDALRTDFEFLVEAVETALEAGATIINIPDTTGFAHPEHYGRVFAELHRRIPRLRDVTVSAHCHDDLGLAVANSLAAIQNGASQVECTINGIGERAGNASLEEIVMALKVRSDHFPFNTGIRTEELYPSSQLVSARTGMAVQPNKAIVGQNAFSHEAGIHQDGVLKKRETYEIMDPRAVGVSGTRIVLSKNSGRHGLKARLKDLGFELEEGRLNEVYERFLPLADSKKEVTDEDLLVLAGEGATDPSEQFQLEMMHVMTGNMAPSSATLTLKKNGRHFKGSAFGQGPVEACFSAIDSILLLRPMLERYEVKSKAPGPKALGEATVMLRCGVGLCVGRGTSVDIIEASLKAYLDACNHILARQARQQARHLTPEQAENLKTSLAW